MNKLAVILFFFISIGNAQKYYEAQLYFKDGSTMEGLATLPSNKLFKNSIKIKSNKKGKTRKVKDKELLRASYTSDSGNTFYFERWINNVTMKSFGKERSGKMYNEKWFLVTFYDPAIMVFTLADYYMINKEGDLLSVSDGYYGISYSFKRPDEEAPTMITVRSAVNNKFVKWSSLYFKDNEDLVRRIKNKEFKKQDMIGLAKAYISYQ